MRNLHGIPGEGTQVTYSGPPELERELPHRDVESARSAAREEVTRAEQALERAASAVARLRGNYPTSLDSTIAWMRSQVQSSRGRVESEGPGAFSVLVSVRAAAAEVERAAESVLFAATAIADSGRLPKGGRA